MDTLEPPSDGKVVRGIGWVSYYLGGVSDTPVCVDVFYVEKRDIYDLSSCSHCLVSSCTVPVLLYQTVMQ